MKSAGKRTIKTLLIVDIEGDLKYLPLLREAQNAINNHDTIEIVQIVQIDKKYFPLVTMEV
jgi:hypothetical protein